MHEIKLGEFLVISFGCSCMRAMIVCGRCVSRLNDCADLTLLLLDDEGVEGVDDEDAPAGAEVDGVSTCWRNAKVDGV